MWANGHDHTFMQYVQRTILKTIYNFWSEL